MTKRAKAAISIGSPSSTSVGEREPQMHDGPAAQRLTVDDLGHERFGWLHTFTADRQLRQFTDRRGTRARAVQVTMSQHVPYLVVDDIAPVTGEALSTTTLRDRVGPEWRVAHRVVRPVSYRQ